MRRILATIVMIATNLLIEVISRPSLSSYSESPSIYEICTKSDLHQIEELRVHLFDNLKNFSKGNKHSTSFGLLEEDWRRLHLLESRLPEDSLLKGKLVRGFRILVAALYQAHGIDFLNSRENENPSSVAVEETRTSKEDFLFGESKNKVLVTSKDSVEDFIESSRPSNTSTSNLSSYLSEDYNTISHDPSLYSIFPTSVPLSSFTNENSIETVKPSIIDPRDEENIKFVSTLKEYIENSTFSEENVTDLIANYSYSTELSTLGTLLETTSSSNSAENNFEIVSEVKTLTNFETKKSYVNEETKNSNTLSNYEEEEKYPESAETTYFSGEDDLTALKGSSENLHTLPSILKGTTNSSYIPNDSFPNTDNFVDKRNLSLHLPATVSTENLSESLPTKTFDIIDYILSPVQSETYYTYENITVTGSNYNPSFDFSSEKSNEFQEKTINSNGNSNTVTDVTSVESINTESDIDHRFFETEITVSSLPPSNNDHNSLEDRAVISNIVTITNSTREEQLDKYDSSNFESQETFKDSVFTTAKTSSEIIGNVKILENNNSNIADLTAELEKVQVESHPEGGYSMPTYSTPVVINLNRTQSYGKGASLTNSSTESSANLEEIESTESEENNSLNIKTTVEVSKENYGDRNAENDGKNDTFSFDAAPTNTSSMELILDEDKNLFFEEAQNLSIALIHNSTFINGLDVDELRSLEDSEESINIEQSRELSHGRDRIPSELFTSLDSKESDDKFFDHYSPPEESKEMPTLFELTTAIQKKDDSVSEETQSTVGEDDLFRPNTGSLDEEVRSSSKMKSLEENYKEKDDEYSLLDNVFMPLESILHEEKYEFDSLHDKHSTEDTETTISLESSSNAPGTESFLEDNSKESFRTFAIEIPRISENALTTNTYPQLEILKQNENLGKFFRPTLSQDCGNGNNCVVVKNIEYSIDSGSTLSTRLMKYYVLNSEAHNTSDEEGNISNLGNYYT